MITTNALNKQPSKCPLCGSSSLAIIQYGYPQFGDQLTKSIAAGDIVLGGCCVTSSDPKWKCNHCGHSIYENNDDSPLVFTTIHEAMEWSRNHSGGVFTRAIDGHGFIAKETENNMLGPVDYGDEEVK